MLGNQLRAKNIGTADDTNAAQSKRVIFHRSERNKDVMLSRELLTALLDKSDRSFAAGGLGINIAANMERKAGIAAPMMKAARHPNEVRPLRPGARTD